MPQMLIQALDGKGVNINVKLIGEEVVFAKHPAQVTSSKNAHGAHMDSAARWVRSTFGNITFKVLPLDKPSDSIHVGQVILMA